MLNLNHLDHITITSSDPERSVHFYSEVLGLERDLEWPGELTMLRCGSMCVAIAWWTKGSPQEQQPAIKIDHFAFRVDKDTYAKARAHLEGHGVSIDNEVDQGICQSLYFRDPDGNKLEFACYELVGDPGKMPTRPNT